jgi:predicted DNA-binding protein
MNCPYDHGTLYLTEVKMTEPIPKLRGEHCLNIFVSHQLKERIRKLADKYDRTMSAMVRTLIKVGIPVMEGLNEAEEKILKDSVKNVLKSKKARQMKIAREGYRDDRLKTET